MAIAVLGPLGVDGRTDGLSPRDRVVLSALVVHAPEPLSTEALADALWGDSPPASWSKVVHGCVARLRKVLGTTAIDRAPAGYLLTLGEDELDHRLFERLLERGREALGAGDPARAAFLIEEALGLWRGRALSDIEEWEPGRVEAARLEGLRMDAEELRVDAELRLGHAPAVLERARVLTRQAPFRERRWALLATAFYQSGRQGEALGAVQRARSMLVDELGLDPGPELVELEQRLLQQDPSLVPGVTAEASTHCPYRGLLPYGAEDAESFFGREDDVALGLRRLRDTGVLAVVGPSGVGKSSLVLAGVVAALAKGGTPVVVHTPGAHPLQSLEGLGLRSHHTLVVDQAEEAVTLCVDLLERERYLTALVDHVGAGGGLVLALRADHLSELASNAGLARLLEEGLCLLAPMREGDLRRAVEGPARRAGLRLEPGLVDLLVRDAEGQPAGLPMLSHVLRETWERREGATLTIDGYRATGGIRRAVAQSAEALYDDLDAEQRTRLRSLLLRLVMPSEDGDPVRAKVPRDKVAGDEEHRGLVERLVEARLLSIDGDSLQIAHEALIRVWPRLRGWLDDDVEGQRLFRHVAGAADAWHGMGRPGSELYRGTRLRRTLEWRDRTGPALTATETAFLAASAELGEADARAADERLARDRRTNRRLRGSLAGVAALLVVAVVTGVLALRSADLAREQQARAERAAVVAEAGRASADGLTTEGVATSLLLQLQALRLDATAGQSWDNLATTLSRGSLPRLVRGPTGASGGYVASFAVSDHLVASTDPVDGVQLYDAKTLAPIPFEDPTPASAVAFSPDGRLLAAAVNHWTPNGQERIVDLPVRLYDLPSGRLSARQLGGWPSGASVDYQLAFSRDGRRIVAGVFRWDAAAADWGTGAVMVWDVAAPEEPVLEVAIPDGAAAAISPDGRRAYTATKGDRPLRVYDVASGRLLQTATPEIVEAGGASHLEVSPDGSTLAVGTRGQVLRLDAATLTQKAPPLRHVGNVWVGWSRDGSMILSTSVEAGGILWDAATGVQRRRLGASVDAGGGFSSDDRTVLSGSGGELAVWDVAAISPLLTAGRAGTLADGELDVSLPAPDGHAIARAAGRRLWFVESGTGLETARQSTRQTIGSQAWSPDSRWFLTFSPGWLSVWDPVTGRLVGERQYARGVGGVAAFSARGDRIYVHGSDGTLQTLDRATLEPSSRTTALGEGFAALLPSPQDRTVLGLGPDGSVARIDPDAGSVVASSTAGLVTIEAEHPGALSPDGALMVAPQPDGSVRLLDTRTFQWVGPATTNPWGDNAAYAPDGSQFASAYADVVRIWDGRTGAYLGAVPLPGPVGEVKVAYLADGSGLLASARDGRTWTIDTDRSAWVDRACGLAGRNLTTAEWALHFPGRAYELTCRQWPAGT